MMIKTSRKRKTMVKIIFDMVSVVFSQKIFKIKTKNNNNPKLPAILSNKIFFTNIALSIIATFPVARSTKTLILAS